MRDEILKFMQQCPEAKQQPFSENPFGSFVRTDIPRALYDTGIVEQGKYKIQASVGAGNWAMIPWICVFDRAITESAQKGVYIVYLLSRDSKRLYLTFNQGCTDLRQQHSRRDTIEIMHQKAEKVRSQVRNPGFTAACDIDLGESLTELGQLYQEGTIFYREYRVDHVPAEEELREDLRKMVQVYSEYSQSLKQDRRIGKFDSWEILNATTAIKHCDKSFFDYNGSGVPGEIAWFFDADQLEDEKSIPLTIIYADREYAGRIGIQRTNARRVRVFWNADLGTRIQHYANAPSATAVFRRISDGRYEMIMKEENMQKTTLETIQQIKEYIAAKGFSYEGKLIENFYLSLKSKPFVILAGTSGTGKTRLGKLFAEAIGAAYKAVAVRPDWSDSSDLFGHLDLNGHFIPGAILPFIREAVDNPDKPYILCLDEMNLARVEYYLSDFLSVIETRGWNDGHITTDLLVSPEMYGQDRQAMERYGAIGFPENLYVVGTVNMDETTFPFSRKVLDRANTIEFNYVNLTPQWGDSAVGPEPLELTNDFLRSHYLLLNECPDSLHEAVSAICEKLERINEILREANAHVGYRVRDEIVFYVLNNTEDGIMTEAEALDYEIMQKILPRIQGSSAALKEMLCELFKEAAGDYEEYQTESNDTSVHMLDHLRRSRNVRYPRSAEKIAFMMRRFEEDGFTSYWL